MQVHRCALCSRRSEVQPRPFTSSNVSSNSLARQFLAIGRFSFSYARRGGSLHGHPPCLESVSISAPIHYVATLGPICGQHLRQIAWTLVESALFYMTRTAISTETSHG